MVFCSMCLTGLINAQSALTSSDLSSEPSVTIESLLSRLQNIGPTAGSVTDYFTKQEQRMLNVHFNGIDRLAPVVITQSLSQTIAPGEQVGCATPFFFLDNN